MGLFLKQFKSSVISSNYSVKIHEVLNKTKNKFSILIQGSRNPIKRDGKLLQNILVSKEYNHDLFQFTWCSKKKLPKYLLPLGSACNDIMSNWEIFGVS